MKTQKKYNDSDVVVIRNLAPWDIGLQIVSPENKCMGINEHIVSGNSIDEFFTYGEIRMQIRAGNTAFVGRDRHGAYAPLYIMDDDQRENLLGVRVPIQLTESTIDEIVNADTAVKLQEFLQKYICTQSDARILRYRLVGHDYNNDPMWKRSTIDHYIDLVLGIDRNSQYYRDLIVRDASIRYS